MQTIIKYTIAILLSFYVVNVSAQETETEIQETQASKIEKLKARIKNGEKVALKLEVEKINERVSKKEITYEKGEELKQEAAKKRALNIENRMAVLENRIEFNKRNNITTNFDVDRKGAFGITFGNNRANLIGLTIIGNKETKPVKYDFRTVSGLVVSAGLNNAIMDGASLSDSPYKIGGSGYFELGFQWRTRVLKNSNAVRLRYGLSFQWNKYDLKDNQFFVQNGNNTTIETFSTDLRQAKFRTTNLVVPIYFEFGQSTKVEKEDRVRYYNRGFKFGIGGYAGVNLGARQKLWYKEDGDRVKQKIKRDYNVNPFVYGVGAYIGLDDVSLFAKYDLSETFKSGGPKQHNLSLGLRLEIE
jgi:hypothetical protein